MQLTKNVLVINQSSELYGADKALLELLDNFPAGYTPIVVLENEGPLKDLLQERGVQIIKCPVVKLNRATLSLKGIFKLFRDSVVGIYLLRKSTRNQEIDLVHSNAIAVFVGAFYSTLWRKKHLWHVHEIIESPKLIATLYPYLINLFADRIVFNSKASYNQFLKIRPTIDKKSEVIYNGQNRTVAKSSPETLRVVRNQLFNSSADATIIGLVGRINRWKGQLVLLEAFADLIKTHKNIHLVFIGSTPPGQDHFLHNLKHRIDHYGLNSKVTVVDFQTDIWSIYDALDICVVPSTEPEPFGLVATEAMLSAKPVVASDHGGLSEIVIHNKTGFLVEPRNATALSRYICKLIEEPQLAASLGLEGRARALEVFSAANYASSFKMAYDAIIYR